MFLDHRFEFGRDLTTATAVQSNHPPFALENDMPPTLFSVGYQKLTQAALVKLVLDLNCVLIDCRSYPSGRVKKGFSKPTSRPRSASATSGAARNWAASHRGR